MHGLLVCERLDPNFYAAVRKNRYVILPVDFEEAWKVCCLVIVWSLDTTANFSPFFSSTSKRSNEQMILTNFVRTIKLFCVHRSLIHFAPSLQIGDPLSCKPLPYSCWVEY